MTENKHNKGEKYISKQGLFVECPINQTILLTPSENSVMNVIRHNNNTETTMMSYSLLEVQTGLSENTIKKALKTLLAMGIIEKGKTCRIGTQYTVKYRPIGHLAGIKVR